MRLRDLFEAPQNDISASSIADRARVAIYNHLYGGGHYEEVAVWSDNGIVVLGEELSIPELTNVAFFFSKTASPRAVQFAIPLVSGHRYMVILRTRVAGGHDIGPTDIMRALLRDNVASAFRHETIHVLDMKRSKRRPDVKYDTLTGDDLKGYHNDPLEQNAYFHEIAEPLLDRLRTIEQDGPEALEIHDPIEPDFRNFLMDRLAYVGRREWPAARHWRLLGDAGRRRLIIRLKALHDRLMAHQLASIPH